MYRVVGEGKAYLESIPEPVPSEQALIPYMREHTERGLAYEKAQLKKLRKRQKERYRNSK